MNEFDVNYAEISGISGAEKAFDNKLAVKNPNQVNDNEISLSLDLPVQAEVENVLKQWQKNGS